MVTKNEEEKSLWLLFFIFSNTKASTFKIRFFQPSIVKLARNSASQKYTGFFHGMEPF